MDQSSAGAGSVTTSREFGILVFAALLNFPWEFLQIPFFKGMTDVSHWDGVRACSLAALGDALIALAAYWAVAAVAGRHWIKRARGRHVACFVMAGIAITVAIERLALDGVWPDAWSYSARMYVLPWIGVGLIPVLQWLLLPPLVLWFTRRHMGLRSQE